MPVHFDFVLNDVDAENLFDIINSAKCKCLEESIFEKRKSYIVAYKKRAKYIDSLKKKLKNTPTVN